MSQMIEFNNRKHDALFVMGPTASGKSALASLLAQSLGGEVINADACQLYSPFPILSAQPNESERLTCPHHLYGVLGGAEAMNAALWAKTASDCAREIYARGNIPIFVGGTGLYFRSLREGLHCFPQIPPTVRQKAIERLAREGQERVHQELLRCDPIGMTKIHPNDTQRLTRALEVFLATDKYYGDFLQQKKTPPSCFQAPLTIVVQPERSALNSRLTQRIQEMMSGGALIEVEAFMAWKEAGGVPAETVMKTIGVRELESALLGQHSLQAALEKMLIATRQYAKRQRTWCRHQVTPDILIESLVGNADDALRHVSGIKKL